jgi:hypothetical protein
VGGTIYLGQTWKMKMGKKFMFGFFIIWFNNKKISMWFRLLNGTLCVFFFYSDEWGRDEAVMLFSFFLPKKGFVRGLFLYWEGKRWWDDFF